MEALLASLGGCMGVDVVMILEKMRTEIESLRLTVRGDRAEAPPRYFHTTTLCFELRGSFTREQAERAVSLSKEKYCSVLHSLRPELRVETEIRLAD
jgi:putative redox protein